MGNNNKTINLELMVGWVIGIAHNDDYAFLEKCKIIQKKIENYTETQTDVLYEVLTKPQQQLKPLEDLWRKENSPDKFTIPDATEFYKWITKKVLDNELQQKT